MVVHRPTQRTVGLNHGSIVCSSPKSPKSAIKEDAWDSDSDDPSGAGPCAGADDGALGAEAGRSGEALAAA